MHKSRLGGFIIDCETGDLKSAASFWAAALGMEMKSLPGAEGEKYIKLVDPADRIDVEVQTVEHASRVHLDIEADDIEAEARRLETLGAKRIAQVHAWWVMEAPTGQRFCIVRAFSKDFAEKARRWD